MVKNSGLYRARRDASCSANRGVPPVGSLRLDGSVTAFHFSNTPPGPGAKPGAMKQITPNLIVPSIEACLPFWSKLGFDKHVEVEHEGSLGFVILLRGDLQLMLQSSASLREDIPPARNDPYRAVLYIHVHDLAPIRDALADVEPVVPERTTFYGAREIIVRDPAGNVVCFAKPTAG